MINFFEQHLMVVEGFLKTQLHALPLDRHSKNVGRSLKKYNVALGEFSVGTTVNLKDAKR